MCGSNAVAINEIYLIFFKCHKQEGYLMDAVSKKNILSLEQSISSLKKFAEEDKEKLKSKKGYLNDNSLVAACSRMIEYYLTEARKASLLTDYLLKEEGCIKIKKKFDSTPSGKRTQQDVDEFNNAVEDINKSLKTFNSTLSELNKLSATALNDWNKT